MKKIILRILVLIALTAIIYFVNKHNLLQRTLDWIDALGLFAPVAFVLIYALTAICFVPAFVFTFSAGALFGITQGLPLSLLGLGIGAVSALLIGRYIARPWVEKSFADNKNFIAMDHAIREKGWKIVTLARLSPVFPFLVANYGFGLTKISARAYFIASLIGSIPSLGVYVYLGSVIGDLANFDVMNRTRTPIEWGLIVGGLLATVLLTYYIRRVSQLALAKNLG